MCRRLLLCLALLSTSLLTAGCEERGRELPEGVAAKVAGKSISERDVNRWRFIVAAQQPGVSGTALPDAPAYTNCVAEGRRANAKARKKAPETPQLTDTQLRQQCESAYRDITEQAMRVLITSRWLDSVAAERNLAVTEQEISDRIEQVRKDDFSKKNSFEEFLARTNHTLADVRLRVRMDLISAKLRSDLVADIQTPDAAEVASYYEQNKGDFGKEETRTVELVLAKTAGDATKVRDAISAGMSFQEAARKWSQDPSTRSTGRLRSATRSKFEDKLADAVFDARRGQLSQPVQTTFGYYIFRVSDINPGSQQSLEEASEAIVATVTAERQRKAVETFGADWEKRYTKKTFCAPQFAISLCSNAPESTPTPAAR